MVSIGGQGDYSIDFYLQINTQSLRQNIIGMKNSNSHYYTTAVSSDAVDQGVGTVQTLVTEEL